MNELHKHLLGYADEIEAICKGDSKNYEDLYDYLIENSLDIEYTVNSKRELLDAHFCIGFGGPNVYLVSTRSGDAKLEGYWGGEHRDMPLSGYVSGFLSVISDEFYKGSI